MNSVVVFTLGCKVNQYESDVMIGALLRAGYAASDKLCAADAYIINTCAVTREAERKSRQAVARARAKNPSAEIFICGCASEKARLGFENLKVDGVYGTKDKFEVLKRFSAVPQSPETTRRQGYVNIQDGCNNFCTYCVIPYLRGRSRSRSISDVVSDVKTLAAEGKAVVLTGINLAMYGRDLDCDLADLIVALSDIDVEISVGSFYVEGINDKLLAALLGLKHFIPHFHLSLQSGDDSVLKAMGRHYTTADYLHSIEKIRAIFPDAILTTDVIVGFPAETDETHCNTMQFLKQAGFNDLHIFVFSKREGTKAFDMPDIDPKIVEHRRKQLADYKESLLKGV